MWKIIAVISLLLSFAWVNTTPGSNIGSLVIDTPNEGGYIRVYAQARDMINERDIPLEIKSKCDSACTLFLSLDKVCISPGAEFYFHSSGDKEADKFMMMNYPRGVRRWIENNGGLSSDVLVMDYATAKRLVDTCE